MKAHASSSRLPQFLVIGAMKAGTTTLYGDLASQPAIYMSTVKEPSVLTRTSDPVAAAAFYRRLFDAGRMHQRKGEASTEYSKLPLHTGVAERARRLLGPGLQAIYVVRNPIERALSHHYHDLAHGLCGPDIDREILANPRLIEFGRYAMQLEPWLDALGREQILVIRFEEFIRARAGTMAAIGRFLGVPVQPEHLPGDRVLNRGEEGRVVGPLNALARSSLYLKWLRPAFPDAIRRRVRDLVVTRPPARPQVPRAETLDLMIERFAADGQKLATLLGWDHPPWDLEETRRKYTQPSEVASLR